MSIKTLLTLTNGDTFIGTDYIAADEYSTMCLDVGLLTVDAEEIQSVEEIEVEAVKHVAVPKSGSKREMAMAIFMANRDESRKFVVEMFMNQLGMSQAGASTYYANCKKEAA